MEEVRKKENDERNINNPEELYRCEILLRGVIRKAFSRN